MFSKYSLSFYRFIKFILFIYLFICYLFYFLLFFLKIYSLKKHFSLAQFFFDKMSTWIHGLNRNKKRYEIRDKCCYSLVIWNDTWKLLNSRCLWNFVLRRILNLIWRDVRFEHFSQNFFFSNELLLKHFGFEVQWNLHKWFFVHNNYSTYFNIVWIAQNYKAKKNCWYASIKTNHICSGRDCNYLHCYIFVISCWFWFFQSKI